MFSPLQIFSSKSSSALSSTNKLKNLIQTLIVSHMCSLIRSLSKFKSIIINIIHNNFDSTIDFPAHLNKNHYSSKTANRIIMGSFRLHYNWCSSKSSTTHHHILPKKWNTVVPHQEVLVGEDFHDLELAGYLQWLEEEEKNKEIIVNDIDLKAEVFIANSHEKFRLEKQESDRKFQEMLARGL
ncbi:hypothetical protein PIB30_003631 [Stylosanthes scabra]|uniref:Uncharacterized protein n=1 Tax=Stylosanthes scabra TaxID=79078 RepID=A0ABU6Y3W8_9FABA|nr:hypothetical protein [Stylosanthes scabra]